MSVRTRVIAFIVAVASLAGLLCIWLEYGGGESKTIILAGINAAIGCLIYIAIKPSQERQTTPFPYPHFQPPPPVAHRTHFSKK